MAGASYVSEGEVEQNCRDDGKEILLRFLRTWQSVTEWKGNVYSNWQSAFPWELRTSVVLVSESLHYLLWNANLEFLPAHTTRPAERLNRKLLGWETSYDWNTSGQTRDVLAKTLSGRLSSAPDKVDCSVRNKCTLWSAIFFKLTRRPFLSIHYSFKALDGRLSSSDCQLPTSDWPSGNMWVDMSPVVSRLARHSPKLLGVGGDGALSTSGLIKSAWARVVILHLQLNKKQ